MSFSSLSIHYESGLVQRYHPSGIRQGTYNNIGHISVFSVYNSAPFLTEIRTSRITLGEHRKYVRYVSTVGRPRYHVRFAR
jgi:hypothetical protein